MGSALMYSIIDGVYVHSKIKTVVLPGFCLDVHDPEGLDVTVPEPSGLLPTKTLSCGWAMIYSVLQVLVAGTT